MLSSVISISVIASLSLKFCFVNLSCFPSWFRSFGQ